MRVRPGRSLEQERAQVVAKLRNSTRRRGACARRAPPARRGELRGTLRLSGFEVLQRRCLSLWWPCTSLLGGGDLRRLEFGPLPTE